MATQQCLNKKYVNNKHLKILKFLCGFHSEIFIFVFQSEDFYLEKCVPQGVLFRWLLNGHPFVVGLLFADILPQIQFRHRLSAAGEHVSICPNYA